MFQNKPRAAPIGNAYRRKCGKITFIVSSFGNPDTKQTADDLILSLMCVICFAATAHFLFWKKKQKCHATGRILSVKIKRFRAYFHRVNI